MEQLIVQALEDGIALRQACLNLLPESLMQASRLLVSCLQKGGKILVCGNGGSAADAQHFAGELVNRFEMNRRGLPAIALTHDASVITSIANDFSFDEVYARQIEALGNRGDVLLAISTSGNSNNVLKAAKQAARQGMDVVALTGRDGGRLGLLPGIVHLNIPHASTPRIQEMHITCLHVLCTLLDESMFGGRT